MKTKLQKVSFNNKEIYVGLDVHSKTWHSTIIIDDFMKRKSFHADPEKVAEYLLKEYPGAKIWAAYEAGCFGFNIQRRLTAAGVKTKIFNPADIPTSDKESKQKTDKNDSKRIALSLKSSLVEGIYIPSIESEQDRILLRRRRDIVKKTTRVKNQIKAMLKIEGISYPAEYEDSRKHWSKRFISWLNGIKFPKSSSNYALDSYLRELEFIKSEKLIVSKQIHALSKSEQYAAHCSLLRSLPGVGLTTAMTVLTEIIDITRFKRGDGFINYLGLSPTEHSSGENRRIGHMTKRCNHYLRSLLIEAAWIAVRTDPAMTAYYSTRLKEMGKTKAIIKVARKLALRLRHAWLSNEQYVCSVLQ